MVHRPRHGGYSGRCRTFAAKGRCLRRAAGRDVRSRWRATPWQRARGSLQRPPAGSGRGLDPAVCRLFPLRTPRPRPGPSAAASGRIPDPALPAPQGAQDHRPDRPRRVRGRAPPRASVPMSFIGREAKALPAFCLGKTPVSGNPLGRVSGALDGAAVLSAIESSGAMNFWRMAGALGFEPRYGGTKNRCLTTWRRPNWRAV